MIGQIKTHLIAATAGLLLAGTMAHAEEDEKVHLEGEGTISIEDSQKGQQSEAGTAETLLPKDERDDVDEDARTAGEEE